VVTNNCWSSVRFGNNFKVKKGTTGTRAIMVLVWSLASRHFRWWPIGWDRRQSPTPIIYHALSWSSAGRNQHDKPAVLVIQANIRRLSVV
jgi:hypothetical protein